ncbi:MAG: TlpA family protein disulfide reductase [Saprospiraceae bacterium]|nr:TlpA family protein disulfide reductase [Saprospiraceae bacterium]
MFKHILYPLLALTAFACTHQPTEAESKKRQDLMAAASQRTTDEWALNLKLAKQCQVGMPQIHGSMTALDDSILETKTLEGKVVVMDFWASWCAPCIERIPKFYETAKQFERDDVAFLLVNVDAEKLHWQKFATERSWTKNSYWIGADGSKNPLVGYSYFIQGEGDTASALMGLPVYVVIGTDGKIVSNANPSSSDYDWTELLKQLK